MIVEMRRAARIPHGARKPEFVMVHWGQVPRQRRVAVAPPSYGHYDSGGAPPP